MNKKVKTSNKENVDWDVVNDFGTEWKEFQFDTYDLDILKETSKVISNYHFLFAFKKSRNY